MTEITIPWQPQPKQLDFLRACGLSHPFEDGYDNIPIADCLGYGGAAGGGKSDALLLVGIIGALTFKGCKIGYFRREFPQLDGPGGAIMRAQELISRKLAEWNGSQRRFTFPNGSILQFCHCQKESDVFNYQSQQFDILLFDEVTQFTRFQVRYLLTRNRATVKDVKPFAAMATNPGNLGHIWFKNEYVDIGSPEEPHDVEIEPGRFETHIFIPSKLADNKILEERDPGYRRKLENQDDNTRKMLLDGDWDVFEGQYFHEWNRDIHTIKPFEIPKHYKKLICGDYGYSKPSAIYWCAIDEDGVFYVYRELYVTKFTYKDLAKEIISLTPDNEKIDYWVFDPAIWSVKGEASISGAQMMEDTYKEVTKKTLNLKKANNDRLSGWNLIRQYLKPFSRGDGLIANLQVFTTCPNLIRTLPSMIYDKTKIEDLNSDGEDHAPDSIRYGIMSKPTNAIDYEQKQKQELLKQFDSRKKNVKGQYFTGIARR